MEQFSGSTPARLRKGDRTRARLIAAAVQVLGRLGYEGASVLEITKAAKVSNATFYLYFKSKAEVIEAAMFQVAGEITRQIYEEEQDIPDVVQRTAYAVRRFISTLLANPHWARAMLGAYGALPDLRVYASKYMLRRLHQGVERGTFVIEGSPLQVECINGVVMTAVRLQLEGAAGPDATRECVELVLRMLGVDREQVKTAAVSNQGS